MNTVRKIIVSSFFLTLLTVFFSFKSSPKAKVIIDFKNYVGNNILQLDSTYKNAIGQNFVIANFKYYIGNICLKETNGKDFVVKNYFLINEHEDESKQITLNDIPEGNYTAIEFIIGVDSLHNCSGLQQGALDPTNGMFWAWNTGYVFLKLDGHATASKSEGNIFEYHIGGYKQPANNIRKITLNFKSTKIVSSANPMSIIIKADALEVLKTPTTIDFSKLPSVTDTRNAHIIANNYMDMFSLLN